MRFEKIKATLELCGKSFLLNLAVRVIWSSMISLVSIFLLVLLARVAETTRSVAQLLSEFFADLFGFFFIMSFILLFGFYMTSAISKWGWEWNPKFSVDLKKRLRLINLETRFLISHGLMWIARLAFLLTLVDLLILARESFSAEHSYFQLGFSLFIVFFSMQYLSLGLSGLLMDRFDLVVLYLERFRTNAKRKIMLPKELMKALRNYNRILGSTLTVKRLVAISQYTTEAYKIGKDEERKDIDEKVAALIGSIKKHKVSEANGNLIALSESTVKIAEQHEKVLGFEVKYPRRYRVGDVLRLTASNIFIQFMVFLLWVLIWIILAYLGRLPSLPPSPPF